LHEWRAKGSLFSASDRCSVAKGGAARAGRHAIQHETRALLKNENSRRKTEMSVMAMRPIIKKIIGYLLQSVARVGAAIVSPDGGIRAHATDQKTNGVQSQIFVDMAWT
jgi:hypothetical protein